MSRTKGTICASTSSPAWMTMSRPSSSGSSCASVTIAATSMRASRCRSRPVISQSIHTRRSATPERLYGPVTVRHPERRRTWPEVAMNLLSDDEVGVRIAGLHPDWSGDHERLRRSIEFADFPTAVEFVNRLAPRCEEINHHPDLALRWRWVEIELSTHSAGGVTDLDVKLAGIVDDVAAELPLAG